MNAHTTFRTILASAVLILAACAPCEAVIVTAGAVDLCPGDEDPQGDDDSSGSDESSGGSCDPAPEAGAPWGPCVDYTCPGSDPAETICVGGDAGTICVPLCHMGLCPHVGACEPDVNTCDATAACIAPCSVNSDCPFAGMACEVIVPPQESRCVWPD